MESQIIGYFTHTCISGNYVRISIVPFFSRSLSPSLSLTLSLYLILSLPFLLCRFKPFLYTLCAIRHAVKLKNSSLLLGAHK